MNRTERRRRGRRRPVPKTPAPAASIRVVEIETDAGVAWVPAFLLRPVPPHLLGGDAP